MSATIKPTLFVGFGGTGALTLQKIKYAIAAHYAKNTNAITSDDIPGCFKFLEVDIDTTSASPMDGNKVLPFSIGAGTEIFITEIGSNGDEVENQIQTYNDDSCKAIKEWWPRGLGNRLKVVFPQRFDQAFQVRQVGRLAIWKNAPEFREKIRLLTYKLSGERLIENVRRDYGKLNNLETANGVNIVVVASLSGGTGCGMLIDGLALIRDVIGKDSKGTVFTGVLLPSCYVNTKGLAEVVDRQAVKTNTYATLKEFDAIQRREWASETVDFGGNLKVSLSRLSDFTYLIGDTMEDGKNLGGTGALAAERLAGFFTFTTMGLHSELNKGTGAASEVAGTSAIFGREVSKAYSAPGFKRFAYPHDQLTEYARLHTVKRLAKLMLRGPSVSEDEVDQQLDPYLQGGQETPVWIQSLMPKYAKNETAVDGAMPEIYLGIKRKQVVGQILKDFQSSIDGLAKEAKRNEDRIAQYTAEAGASVEHNAQDFFRREDLGLQTSKKYLKELRAGVTGFVNAKQADLAAEEAALEKLPSLERIRDQYSDVGRGLMKFQSTVEGRINELLGGLKGRIAKGRTCSMLRYQIKLATKIGETVDSLKDRLDKLEQSVLVEMNNHRDPEKTVYRSLLEGFDKGELFLCSKTDIEKFEQPLKAFAVTELSGLKLKIQESGWVWPVGYISELAKRSLAQNVKAEPFLKRYQEYLEAGNTDAEDRTQGFGTHLTARTKKASPMTVTHGEPKAKPKYYLLANFTGEDLGRYGVLGENITLITVDYIKPYEIVAVAMRNGLLAADIQEVWDCQSEYKALNGISRPKQFPGLTAHLFERGKKANELIGDTQVAKIDVRQYVELCKTLGVIKKSPKGNYFYLSLTSDEPTAKQNDGFWNGEKKMEEDFANDRSLGDKVKDAAISRICVKYSNDRPEYVKWTATINRKTKMGPVPEEIDSGVKLRLNWA
jgi:hypothetical protein